MIFDYSNINDKGAISYIISHNTNKPSFIRNQDPIYTNVYNPKNSYLDWGKTCNIFDTNLTVHPFFIINLVDYKVKPISYSFSLKEDNSPPVIWDLSGSNDADNWEILSNPEKNISVCENHQNQNVPEMCNKDTIVHYDITSNNNKFYQFIRFRVLLDRKMEYKPNSLTNLYRVGFIELYGTLQNTLKFTSKITFRINFIPLSPIIFCF